MKEHLKRVAAHHNWWSERYDSDYFEHYALYHNITLDNIRRFLPKEKDAPILDAEGGTGIWSIELSQGMLNKARKKISELKLVNQIEIKISNICAMPEFGDNQFAMVLCEGDPLSYCGDHHAAIKEFTRVVQPGGTVTASVDNRASALNWLRDKDDPATVEKLLETGKW